MPENNDKIIQPNKRKEEAMKKTLLYALAAVLLPAVLGAWEIVPGTSIEKPGSIKIGNIYVSVIHFGPNWSYSNLRWSSTPESGYPRYANRTWETKSSFKTKNGPVFSYTEKIVPVGNDAMKVTMNVTAAKPIESSRLYLEVDLPTSSFAGKSVMIDGKSIALPEQCDAPQLGYYPNVSEVVIPRPDGELIFRGSFKQVMIQDGRKFNGKSFSVGFDFSNSNDMISESSMEFELQLVKSQSAAINLAPAANRFFRDEKAGDKQGGWTDQGPENDMRMLASGQKKTSGESTLTF